MMREGHIEFPLGTECVITEMAAIPDSETKEVGARVTINYWTDMETARGFAEMFGGVVKVDRSDEHEALIAAARKIAADRAEVAEAEAGPEGRDGKMYHFTVRKLIDAADALSALLPTEGK